jgi:hypothetical protein
MTPTHALIYITSIDDITQVPLPHYTKNWNKLKKLKNLKEVCIFIGLELKGC